MARTVKAHSTYSMTYRLVFVTIYKKPLISNKIAAFMEKRTHELCEKMGGSLTSFKADSISISIRVSLPPQQKPCDVARILKTQLSKETRMAQEFKDEFASSSPKDALWGPSYFIATEGGPADKQIQDYINSQKTDDSKRKYEKSGKYAKKYRDG